MSSLVVSIRGGGVGPSGVGVSVAGRMHSFIRRVLIAILTAGLMTGSMTPRAESIVDTGEPSGEAFENAFYRRAARFTVEWPFVITSVQRFLRTTHGGPGVSVVLRADDGGLPGNLLFSAPTPMPPAEIPPEAFRWHVVSDLKNWSLPAGTYWISFETNFSQTGRYDVLVGLDATTYPPNPLSEAVSYMGTETWSLSTGRTGWRIEGAVESPTSLINDLVEEVVAIGVDSRVATALDRKLQSALDALDRARNGDNASAAGMLYAFIQNVEAQRGKKLDNKQADILVSGAEAIIDLLSQP